MSEAVEFIPRPERGQTSTGGIYGMAEIVKWTGLPAPTLKQLYQRRAFPMVPLSVRGRISWYLHKDLFYMWMLSTQRWHLIQYRTISDIIVADALRHLENLKTDLGLNYPREEAELFKRIYRRVFGSDDAINMVTGYDNQSSSNRSRIDAFIDGTEPPGQDRQEA